jgi:hypothetical protein
MVGSGPRSILLVEELAHWTHGHFPVRCAQLATAYVDLGYRVELLTSEGWARDFDHPQPPFAIRRYRLLPRWFRRLVARSSRPGRNQLLTLALVAEARAAARQMVPEPAAVIVLVLTDSGRSPQSPPTQIAEGPRTTSPPQTAPPLQTPGVTPGRGAAPGTPIVTPLGIDVPATDLEPLFALAASRVVDLGLRLDGETFAPTATVTATLTLPADGHVSVVVRGPDGRFRELSLTTVPTDVLTAGDHSFTFPAAGPLDPAQGGASTLRVFIVPGSDVPPAGEARWRWMLERAGFDEVTYATAAQ